MNSGCIYVIFNPTTNLVKVGISENVNARKNNLECACGVPLELVYSTDYILCVDKYETDAHIKLNDFRAIGEWFNVTPILAVRVVEDVIKDATQDPIVEQYKKGVSISSISKRAGVTRQAILARLKNYGVYNMEGRIPEVKPTQYVRKQRIVDTKITDKRTWDVKYIKDVDQIPLLIKESPDAKKEIESKFGDVIFLDDVKPKLPLSKVKRLEPNINYNNEWYQANIYFKGSFITAYSKNLDKIRQFIVGIKNNA